MSRSGDADRRFRVVCETCDWHGHATYPNALVTKAEAERHDERVHDGEEHADVEMVRVSTDGSGEIAPEDDRVDPGNLPESHTPALVDVDGQGPVYVADIIIRENGWVSVREWTGDRCKLPPHRVLAVRNIPTERYGERDDHGYRSKRVASEKWREEARADYPDEVDGHPVREEVDRGDGVRPDGGEREDWYPCESCGAEYRNPDAAAQCCTEG